LAYSIAREAILKSANDSGTFYSSLG